MHDTIQLGDVTVTRVLEWSGPLRMVSDIVPDSTAEGLARLGPDFRNPDTGAYHCAIQSWVLRSEGRTIVVDTGAGNDRDRPQIPVFDHLRTPFLDNLRRAGVEPEDVDLVVNTHVHYDHVGWNTHLVNGEWAPTFPNARYLIPRIDRQYFDPVNEHRRPPARTDADRLRRRGSHLVFADSIVPILDHGLAMLWEDSFRIDRNLTLTPAPGHTPGSSVLRLTSGTDRAFFVGDLVHSPIQVAEPAANSCFCENPAEARATRRRLLDEAAETRALVVPAHFPGHGAAEVRRSGDGYELHNWAAFEPVRVR
ncbi:MBL fold metallo-hydrolase [Amycolatopsis deserti]|uniref:MBL fold metallo-hydrolase n=1 Tax=Amycolatopsis deserti TaxID=185696 RepID=A0ABQ3ITK7_9PSEU|nr:MBL fold metallo-hydrolase [Amycolatopsis deserti]GHE88936.1 MBL fold metallo-hydrolase [Amycolatopsis deserti]